jgi:salicylate hydroxylase
VAPSRTILIAGAGIGGLTAALAIARRGLRVRVLDQAPRLDEIGAGIQLSPNASRILIALGLGAALRPHVVAPTELRVMDAHSARVLARSPLGDEAEHRYGAPYWVIHRGDLQGVLRAAVESDPNIELCLGTRVEDFAIHGNGVTVAGLSAGGPVEERGFALVGADGLWSGLRRRIGDRSEPRFARRTAWRALVPTEALLSDFSAPIINLWLGRDAHLVYYPLRGGTVINIVAVVRDEEPERSWQAPGLRADLLERFRSGLWPPPARAILAAPRHWQRWGLFDRPPLRHWTQGPITLLGDAAHPMLPFLAQGAAMAIEDAEVLSRQLAQHPDNPAAAMRLYERQRRPRTNRVQRAARANSRIYHLRGAGAVLRALALAAMGGRRLLTRYDWLYGWRPS